MINLRLKASFFQSMAIYSVNLRCRLMTYWQQVMVKQFIINMILLEFTYLALLLLYRKHSSVLGVTSCLKSI